MGKTAVGVIPGRARWERNRTITSGCISDRRPVGEEGSGARRCEDSGDVVREQRKREGGAEINRPVRGEREQRRQRSQCVIDLMELVDM